MKAGSRSDGNFHRAVASVREDTSGAPRFTEADLHRQAALRVAVHIRGLWEEKGSSDSRLLEALLLPDRFTLSGRSHAAQGAGCREHVVPRKVVVDECHRMLARGDSDDDIATFIQDHVRIVVISTEERILLDRHLGLRQRMPHGWRPGDDIYARLRRPASRGRLSRGCVMPQAELRPSLSQAQGRVTGVSGSREACRT